MDQQPGLQKLYYIGPMFRRERPQKGRYRQFYQIGAEAIGSESPAVDAEVIEMVVEILSGAGLEDFQAADQFRRLSEMPCRVRGRVARAAEGRRAHHVLGLPAPRRNESAARARLQGAGRPADYRVRCRRSSTIWTRAAARTSKRYRRYLTDRGIAFEVKPRLVRGLDYYTRTTFEIVHGSLGAQNSVLGGGRYDGLAEALGSKVPAPGHRLLDRRRPAGDERRREVRPDLDPVELFIAPMGEEAFRHCSLLAREIRAKGAVVEIAPDRQAEKIARTGEQDRRAADADRRRQRNRVGRVRAEKHDIRRADIRLPRRFTQPFLTKFTMPEPEQSLQLDFLGDLRRTHTCGQLRREDAGSAPS